MRDTLVWFGENMHEIWSGLHGVNSNVGRGGEVEDGRFEYSYKRRV